MLEGKTGIVFGIANKRSIAWAITKRTAEAGARLALTYQTERLGENVRELAATLTNDPLLLPCDVAEEAQVEAVFQKVAEEFGGLDFLIHSIAYAPREDLEGDFINTSREGFRITQDVSAYSLVALSRRAAPLMEGRGGSIVTLTYLGGERVMPGYNVMGVAKAALESSVKYLACELGPKGIRVNALSPGPIKTLAASGVSGISKMIKHVARTSPLRKNTETAEVADAALFLVSHLSRGITGEIIYVDGGYHIMGMTTMDETPSEGSSE
jgi:enoyl-[acyl-carrier protein] reductase I